MKREEEDLEELYPSATEKEEVPCQSDSDSDLDLEEEMTQRGNARWSLKDLSKFHGKRDGIEQVRDFNPEGNDVGNLIECR